MPCAAVAGRAMKCSAALSARPGLVAPVDAAQRVPAEDPADRPDARNIGPENLDLAKKELTMGTKLFNRWVWLLPALAVFALPSLPAVAADRLVIAEEFTSNT